MHFFIKKNDWLNIAPNNKSEASALNDDMFVYKLQWCGEVISLQLCLCIMHHQELALLAVTTLLETTMMSFSFTFDVVEMVGTEVVSVVSVWGAQCHLSVNEILRPNWQSP